MTPRPRHLYEPKPVTVRVEDKSRMPAAVEGIAVEAIREAWEVDDRWWLPQNLHREYFELALFDGRSVVVFRCVLSGRWYRQRA